MNIDNNTAALLCKAQLERVDTSLARNWTTQMVLVVISILSFTEKADSVPKALAPFIGFEVSLRATSFILAVLLIYYFIRFGYEFGLFWLTRQACDELTSANSDPGKLRSAGDWTIKPVLFETLNFFEPAYQSQSVVSDHKRRFADRGGTVVVMVVFVVTTVVIALSHASVFVHVYKATNEEFWWSLIPNFLVFCILGACYRQNWTSKVKVGGVWGKWTMVVSGILTLILVALYFSGCAGLN